MDELLERMMAAMRKAAEAGDTTAVRTLQNEMQRLQYNTSVPASHALVPGAAVADTAQAPGATATRVSGGVAQPSTGARPITPISGGSWDPLTAREEGAASVEPGRPGTRVAAAAQGFGSGFFGLGTPLVAAGEFAARAMPGGQRAISPSEALEWAKGRREALAEAHPREFYAGMGSSLVGGISAVRAAAKAAPRVATVFTPQSGQTVKNAGRLAAAGAAAASVTAANEQGVEAVPAAAAMGTAAGLVGGGLVGGGAKLAGATANVTRNTISPDHAAMKLLSKHLKMPAQELSDLWNRFSRVAGRPPSLTEISREASETMAHVGRVRPTAGVTARVAADAAELARPVELPPLIQAGGRLANVPAAEAGMRETVGAAGEAVRQRSVSTVASQTGRRDVQFDRVMRRIGTQRVPITDDMLEVIQHPDVWNSLDSALRRRVAGVIEQGQQIGSVDLSVRSWDAIRQELAAKAGAGAGQIYARLRDKVRDYVGAAVPEYTSALSEFGRRSDVIQGTVAGTKVLTQATRDFVAGLRTAGGGTERVSQRPETRTMIQAGARGGIRQQLQRVLGGAPEKADAFMRRLSSDRSLQRSIKAALSDNEATQLIDLARKYGYQLEHLEGIKLGGMITRRTGGEAFEEAVVQASQSPAKRVGVEKGARTALVEAAGESSTGATTIAARLGHDPGMQSRVRAAFGVPEADRLGELGKVFTEAAQNVAASVPTGTTTSARLAMEGKAIQDAFAAGGIAMGRGSVAMMANWGKSMVERLGLRQSTAERFAKMLTDPAQSREAIDRLLAAGMKPAEIRRMFVGGAAAAGVAVGKIDVD